MKNLIINLRIIVVMFAIILAGHSQVFGQLSITDFVINTNLLPIETPTSPNDPNLDLVQIGSSNSVELTQVSEFQYNPNSRVVLQQYGYLNSMEIIESNPNGIITVAQNGDNNQLNMITQGENLKLTNIQQGNNNQINQTILESGNVEMTLIQDGNNHNVEQTINSQAPIEMTIIQKGQGAGIIISHN